MTIAGNDRLQVAPPQVNARVVGFAVDRARRVVLQERAPGQPWGRLHTGCRKDRGHDIHELHRVRNGSTRSLLLWELDEQRNLNRLAIEKDAVLILAVIAEPLAMVGEDHDQRIVVHLRLLEMLHEGADDRVDGLDLRVVRGLVRRVRLEEMKEEKL